MLGHPSSFFKLMRDDTKEDDGLTQRFLPSSPEPCFFDAYVIESANNIQREFTLTVLLYTIHRYHNDNESKTNLKKLVTYKLEDSGREFYKKTYSGFSAVVKKMHDYDVFIW
jgi:hypothetical protein